MADSSSSEARSHPPAPQAQQSPQTQRHASRSRQRGRSHSRRTDRSPSVASTVSDAGPEEVLPNNDSRRKRKNKKRQNELPVVDEVESTGKEVAGTAGNAVQSVGNAAGGATQSGGGKSDNPLKLRLDLNLDVDIRLTAKVHGDVTLSLLG